MYRNDLTQRIAQEQREKVIAAVESAAVTLFGVVTGALLPQMLYQYMLSSGELIDPPAYLQYIPHAGYALAVIFFANALVGNFFRTRRIRAYTQELDMMSYMDEDCCCGDCEECRMDGGDNEEATQSLAKAMAKSETKARTKKVAAKKTTKTTKKSAK